VNVNSDQAYCAVYRNRQVELDEGASWPDGTRLLVMPVSPPDAAEPIDGPVIIVGFGLAGRCVVDLLDQAELPYTIIEQNSVTVETQRALGRNILEGDATKAETLVKAGLNTASILALTIPDEEAVLRATALARRLRPEIYIIARTNYSSKGMRASQLGADDVIKAEQAVALQFYEKLSHRIRRAPQQTHAPDR
jgi:CPA2 family monovalent cation:H+ antiporter-2